MITNEIKAVEKIIVVFSLFGWQSERLESEHHFITTKDKLRDLVLFFLRKEYGNRDVIEHFASELIDKGLPKVQITRFEPLVSLEVIEGAKEF